MAHANAAIAISAGGIPIVTLILTVPTTPMLAPGPGVGHPPLPFPFIAPLWLIHYIHTHGYTFAFIGHYVPGPTTCVNATKTVSFIHLLCGDKFWYLCHIITHKLYWICLSVPRFIISFDLSCACTSWRREALHLLSRTCHVVATHILAQRAGYYWAVI